MSGKITAQASFSPVMARPEGNTQFDRLFAEFLPLLHHHEELPAIITPVSHHLVTRGPPVNNRPTLLAPDNLAIARAEFERMLQLGIIRPSGSPCASPLHMVPKKTPGDWRPCGDYCLLNKVTTPNRYPIPHLHDITSALQKCTIFSKIDLVRYHQQISLAEADIRKTAVTNLFGLF